MRKLSRVSGTVAAALAAAVTASAFTCSPQAAASRPVPSRPAAHGPAVHRSAVHRSAVHGPATSGRLGQAGGLRPGGPAILAGARRPPFLSTRMSTDNERSLNWGGYAATGTRFRFVQATFFAPYLDCPAVPDGYSTHWVGLDGLHNSTVEQAGISANCNGKTPDYRTWYEMAPREPVYRDIAIHAGDSVTASVSYRRHGRFTLSLTDTTSGRHFSKTLACPSAGSCARASAEVISEAPLGPLGFLPLADFRCEAYSGIRVTSQSGRHGGLRSSAWSTTRVTTVASGGAVLDQPTSLYRGVAFGMYWMRAS